MLEVVKGPDSATGFEGPPRRWVVAGAIAWINGRRRPAKDHGNLNQTALAFIRSAGISLLPRRLTR